MDCRVTIGAKENFPDLLRRCMEENMKAEMLLDKNGLERAGGYVKSLDNEKVILEDGQEIELQYIVAVNGIFAESYSGC